MDYLALAAELNDDPLTRGYAGMTDQQAADSLNAVDRSVDVETVTGSQIFEAVVPAEYNALSAEQKTLFLGIVGMGTILVKGANTRTALGDMFSAGPTRDALLALQTEAMSRAGELGLRFLYAGHVYNARAT